MGVGGKRHTLLLYTSILDRWRKMVMGVGTFLLLLTVILGVLPSILIDSPLLLLSDMRFWWAGGICVVCILAGYVMGYLGKLAYVQPFQDHVALVTPLLRMNISYRRIRQTASAEMGRLFPGTRVPKRDRAMLARLSSQTAVILDLTGFPIARRILEFFLSRYFFPDDTSRLNLLVSDWIPFSTELESFRSVWRNGLRNSKSPTIPGSIFQKGK